MFLHRERPLATLFQLGGVGLIAYDLTVGGALWSSAAALLGLALLLTGSLLANRRS